MSTTTPHWGFGYDASDDAYARHGVGYDRADDAYAHHGVGYDIADDRAMRGGLGYDRADDAYARTGMGDAASDLATFDGFVATGDNALNAGQWQLAVTSYQEAGQFGAVTLGPEIDAATNGASTSMTQQAWSINTNLAAVNNTGSATQDDATSAQGFARQMQSWYHQAAVAGSAQATTPMTAPSAALTSAAQAVVDYINANGCSQASLPVVSTFQSLYNNECQVVLTIDGEYGPDTQRAVQRVLGHSPNDCFTGVAPHGGGSGKLSVPVTNVVGTPSSNLKWWLIGGGVVAGGGAIAYAVHRRRKMRRR